MSAYLQNKQLLYNSSTIGDEDSSTIELPFNVGLQVTSYGDDEELWGASLTPAIVNDESFGVSVDFMSDSASPRSFNVDYVRLTVYYEESQNLWELRTEEEGGGVLIDSGEWEDDDPFDIQFDNADSFLSEGVNTFYFRATQDAGAVWSDDEEIIVLRDATAPTLDGDITHYPDPVPKDEE